MRRAFSPFQRRPGARSGEQEIGVVEGSGQADNADRHFPPGVVAGHRVVVGVIRAAAVDVDQNNFGAAEVDKLKLEVSVEARDIGEVELVLIGVEAGNDVARAAERNVEREFPVVLK